VDMRNNTKSKVGRVLEAIYLCFLVLSTLVFFFILQVPPFFRSGDVLFELVLFILFCLFALTVILVFLRKKAGHIIHVFLRISFYIMVTALTFYNLFWLLNIIFLVLFPPVIHEGNAVHKVMPLGHFFFSFVLSVLAAIIIPVIYFNSFHIIKRFHAAFCSRHSD
jgi:hypothetical protein